MTDSWVATALRHHGLEPDPISFPGRKLPSLVSGGTGAFVWVYRRGEQRFEFAWPSRRLSNGDVASMLFRAGIRIEIPAEDLNGEAHPRLTGESLDDSEVRDALIDDSENLLSAHRDTRESA